MTDIYTQLAKRLIMGQEQVVGPLAWSQANKVGSISISNHTVNISGDGKESINQLIKQYQLLFGKTSLEFCKDAVKDILPTLDEDEIPESLR